MTDEVLARNEAPRPYEVGLVVRAGTQVGGLETVVRDAARSMAAPDLRLSVIVHGGDSEGTASEAFFADLPRVSRVTTLRQALATTRRADLIHLHAPTLVDWPLRLALALRLSRMPVMLTLHLPGQPHGRHILSHTLILVRRLGRAFALRLLGVRLFAPSADAAAQATGRFFGIVQVHPLLQGVPDPGPRPFVDGERPLRVVFVGRLVEQKQPLLLIDALSGAIRRGAKVSLDVVGDGPLMREVQDRIRKHGLDDDAVRLHGYLRDPGPVVAASDLLVLPSEAEGCPVVVMEAAALGRASVVRAGLSGMEEVLSGAYVAVPAGSGPDGFAQALADLAGDRAAVRDAGERARRRFEEGLSLAQATERYAAVYRSLLSGKERA